MKKAQIQQLGVKRRFVPAVTGSAGQQRLNQRSLSKQFMSRVMTGKFIALPLTGRCSQPRPPLPNRSVPPPR
jgi:hypothetical protein